jgi:hypothetical protein
MGQPTFVLNDPLTGEAFIQVRYRPHQAAADVVALAPSLSEHTRAAEAWSRLLDGACIEAAGQGIRRVFANLSALGEEVDVFQQAGFTAYAGEDIYRRLPGHGSPSGAAPAPAMSLRPQQAEDWPALQRLCVAIVPQRVRQAEGGIGLPNSWEKHCWRYVLPAGEGGDLHGALTVCAGGQVHWLRVLLHPDACNLASNVVGWGLATLAQQPAKAVYCTVRQYENGVREALEQAGFEPFTSRTSMVKYTLAGIKGHVQDVVPALKGSAEPIPPAYRINGELDLTSYDGQLAVDISNDNAVASKL